MSQGTPPDPLPLQAPDSTITVDRATPAQGRAGDVLAVRQRRVFAHALTAQGDFTNAATYHMMTNQEFGLGRDDLGG